MTGGSGERSVEWLADQLISPRTGILSRVLRLPRTPGMTAYQHYAGAVPDYAVLPTGGTIARPGGCGWGLDDGLAQVLFEGMERYCAAFLDHAALLRSAVDGPQFVAGARLQRFADHQYEQAGFPYRPLEDQPISWVGARSLLTGDHRWAPAVFTYLPFVPLTPEEVLGPSFSTGMAGAWTPEEACLGGLLEVVERDAFALTWQARIVPPRLVLPASSTMGLRVAAVERDELSDVVFLDLTTDLGIPVVACVLRRATIGGRRLVTIGLSCKQDITAACEKALCEALSDHERLRQELETGEGEPWRPAPDFSDVGDFPWHGRAYVHADLQPALEFLTSSDEVRRISGEFLPDGAKDLSAALSALEPHVSDVLMVDLTTRDVASLGVTVVKVLVPELVPLHADHRFPYLGHRRLEEALHAQGRADANPFPHPFS